MASYLPPAQLRELACLVAEELAPVITDLVIQAQRETRDAEQSAPVPPLAAAPKARRARAS